MTKHTPVTPLPWTVKGASVFNGPRKVCTAVEHIDGDSAAYIAHAANAYPKMVEALRIIKEQTYVDAYGPELRGQNQANHRRASELLRELGEE